MSIVITDGKATGDKYPGDVLDYKFNWSRWLTEAGNDTIVSHTVTAIGVTLDSSTDTDTVVTAFLSGGIAGETAEATCQIVTTGGRTVQRTLYITIL
jgi:hypothetical protein